jgi:hypothetical protein
MIKSVRMKRASGMYRLPFITVGMLLASIFISCEMQGQTRCMVSAFTSSSPKRESRYFAQESMLPPLPRIDVENTVTPARESDRSLPVLYTNDPKLVSRWLSDNIETDGCTLGFDLEVSKTFHPSSVCSFIRCRFIQHPLSARNARAMRTIVNQTLNSNVSTQISHAPRAI